MLEFLLEVYTLLNNNDLEMAKILVSEKIEEIAGVEDEDEMGFEKIFIGKTYTTTLLNRIEEFETGSTQSICNYGQKAVDNNGTE